MLYHALFRFFVKEKGKYTVTLRGLSNTRTNLCMALYCIVFTLQY